MLHYFEWSQFTTYKNSCIKFGSLVSSPQCPAPQCQWKSITVLDIKECTEDVVTKLCRTYFNEGRDQWQFSNKLSSRNDSKTFPHSLRCSLTSQLNLPLIFSLDCTRKCLFSSLAVKRQNIECRYRAQSYKQNSSNNLHYAPF